MQFQTRLDHGHVTKAEAVVFRVLLRLQCQQLRLFLTQMPFRKALLTLVWLGHKPLFRALMVRVSLLATKRIKSV